MFIRFSSLFKTFCTAIPLHSLVEGAFIGLRDHSCCVNASCDSTPPKLKASLPSPQPPILPPEESILTLAKEVYSVAKDVISVPTKFEALAKDIYSAAKDVDPMLKDYHSTPTRYYPTPTRYEMLAIASPSSTPFEDFAAARSGCTSYSQCKIYFPSVGVYYWPHPDQNTDCLAKVSVSYPFVNPILPESSFNSFVNPILPQSQSPSIMVVFTSIEAHDGCRTIGTTVVHLSHIFHPSDLATGRENDDTLYTFNPVDFPCPPASVGWTGPYMPRITPPTSFFKAMDPAWSTCVLAANQGIDPPTAFPTADRPSDNEAGKIFGLSPRLRRRQGRAAEDAVTGATPTAAPKTTM